jgi:protease-4
VIDKGYRDFTGKVAKARGRSVEQIDAIARGRVWSGEQAKERGLVDAFGGLDAAVADAASRAKLGKPNTWQTRYIEPGVKPFGQWLSGLVGSHAELGDAALKRHRRGPDAPARQGAGTVAPA